MKILQQSKQVFTSGSEIVKLISTTFLVLIDSSCLCFKNIPFTFHGFCVSIA